MKKLITLLLCLSLITTCFIGCASNGKKLDNEKFSSSETSVETTSEETTTKILETESEITSADTSDTVETTIVTEAEESTTEKYFPPEPIYEYFSSYDEFEKSLSGENEEGYRELQYICYDVPDVTPLMNTIRKDDNLKKPLINGVPMKIDEAGVYVLNFESSTFNPHVHYEVRDKSNPNYYKYIGVSIYYVDIMYNRDFSTLESPLEISKEIFGKNFNANQWTEKTMSVGGEDKNVIEYLIDADNSYRRSVCYYEDGLLISITANYKNGLTDELLQSFSVGYVVPDEINESPLDDFIPGGFGVY